MKEDSPQNIGIMDLGSNSYHLIIYAWDGKTARPIERVRECVQLAKYLTSEDELNAEGLAISQRTIASFAHTIAKYPLHQLRIVGTSTLRTARNREKVQESVRQLLQAELEVISGEEEARLIYLGAMQNISHQLNTLVIDIGGGSTEVIQGTGLIIEKLISIPAGCVTITRQCTEFHDQIEYAKSLFLPLQKEYMTKWQMCCGCSGTVRALIEVIRAYGWASDYATAKHLQAIKDYIASGQVIGQLPGIRHNRHDTFQAGVALLYALFDIFSINEMHISYGGIREGLLADLLHCSEIHFQ